MKLIAIQTHTPISIWFVLNYTAMMPWESRKTQRWFFLPYPKLLGRKTCASWRRSIITTIEASSDEKAQYLFVRGDGIQYHYDAGDVTVIPGRDRGVLESCPVDNYLSENLK